MKASSRFLVGTLLIAIWIAIGFTLPSSNVQASWLDRFKDIYQLPENVEQIQKDYEATKQQLEEQKDKLSEAIQRSQETEEKLLAQNQTLQKENELLQQRLKAMEQIALNKEKRNHTIMVITVTAIAFVVFYFVLGRLFRFIVWRRQRRRPRP
ncbi:hypothetical protein GK047_25040 [Paenibacillus sp. SYP-B3998]|uniref:Uncharacterized protein n=1 Tax=Paenibacillus sp. SYP-B3998 TaxID=2678564 RepID=A0A6G4A4I4_9BACL|nr:hypothetical protein [Paenibacillus sp. SYP-B3998]NEW09240.1 hypothetical protein [Paenibacillus sp. SYP-B3998]